MINDQWSTQCKQCQRFLIWHWMDNQDLGTLFDWRSLLKYDIFYSWNCVLLSMSRNSRIELICKTDWCSVVVGSQTYGSENVNSKTFWEITTLQLKTSAAANVTFNFVLSIRTSNREGFWNTHKCARFAWWILTGVIK